MNRSSTFPNQSPRVSGSRRWITWLPLLTLVLLVSGSAEASIVGWEEIGPEGYGVSMIAVAPSCPDTILVTTSEDNYLMRTTDGGATWEGVLGIMHDVSALTFDPSDPMIAYCASLGVVHKSVDAGEHWTAVSEDIAALSIVVDPSESRRIFAGTMIHDYMFRSVYFSPDGGTTWTRIGIDPQAGDGFSYVSDIALDPSDTSAVYAATMINFTGPDHAVWKTTDFGQGWVPLAPFGEWPYSMTDVSRLYMDPNDPGFLVAAAGPRGNGPFYVTTDGGVSGNVRANVGVDETGAEGAEVFSLASSPRNPATLIAMIDPDYSYQEDMYLSFDMAGRWRLLLSGPIGRTVFDHRARVLYATSSGVKRSIHDGAPDLVYASNVVDDAVGGDGDGIPEAGETFTASVTIQNQGDRSSDIQGVITCDDVFVQILSNTAEHGVLEFGEYGGTLSPYELYVDPSREDGPILLDLHLSSGVYGFDDHFYAGARVAVMDDDNNRPYDSDLLEALDANLIGYDVIPTISYEPITYERLAPYSAIIWTTGGCRTNTITGAEEQVLMQYLDNGGALYLTSQDYLSDAGGGEPGVLTAFGMDYLHLAGYFNDFSSGGVQGVDGDPIGDGMYADPLEYPFDDYADSVFPDSTAAAILMNAPSGAVSNSIRYPKDVGGETFRVVFTAFPFEAFPKEGADPHNQETLIRRIMEWLVPQGGLITTGVPEPENDWVPDQGLSVTSFPNPQAGYVTLALRLGASIGSPEIAVYAAGGRLVRELVVPASRGEGTVFIAWDGRDSEGRPVASGVYFVRARSGDDEARTKIVLIE